MSAKENILKLLQENKEISVKEITDILHVSKQMAHIVLNQLMEQGTVYKLGRVPHTSYRLKTNVTKSKESQEEPPVPAIHEEFLNRNFLEVTPIGDLLQGSEAFNYWCNQRNLPTLKTLDEYIRTTDKYKKYHDGYGYIKGIEKLKNTKGYDHIWLDSLFYLDFYAIERFGKTRLGALLHYAKQGQNKYLMSLLVQETREKIMNFLKIHKADAIGFVPPTIRREVQFMKYLETHLKITLPAIKIRKMSGIIPVPQKSLSKLEDRISNATNTFAIADQRSFRHVVLIDDAVGSGSTLNQIAEKIKTKKSKCFCRVYEIPNQINQKKHMFL